MSSEKLVLRGKNKHTEKRLEGEIAVHGNSYKKTPLDNKFVAHGNM